MLGDVLARKCTRTYIYREMVLLMLTVALTLSGSSLREGLSLTQLNTTLMLTGEADSPFGHMHDLILQHLKSCFSTVCPTCLIKDTIRGIYLPHQWWITTPQQGGFCLKKLVWDGGLYICKYCRIQVHSHFVKFAQLSWLRPKHTEKRQEYI